jgi:dipeptide/tripeptide permease
MQALLGSLIGVPATILIAGGFGLALVTPYTHVVRRPGRQPIRWRHLGLGLVLLGLGVLLLEVEIVVIG